MLPQIFLLLCILGTIQSKSVIDATEKSFKNDVLNHKGVAIVEFYAPWCGHCKSFAPEYEKAAGILDGVVRVVAVDATAHESLAQKYEIKGFPTVKVFGADKKKPVDYQGARTSDAVVSEGMKAANALVKDRKKGGGKGAKESKPKKESKGKAKEVKAGSVITLTDDNFDTLVLGSQDHWLVEFYAPWCGHCKNLEPEWKSAAKELGSTPGIKLGAVDATVATNLASKYKIKGFPTIKVFNAGDKKKKPVDYQGPRESAGIVEAAIKSYEKVADSIPVTVHQITNQNQFDELCGVDANRICATFFLPHILDTGAKGRQDYLSTIQDMAKSFRQTMTMVWVEGGAQSNLESIIDLGPMYPSLVIFHANKNLYSINRLSWNTKNIKNFLEKPSGLVKLPSIPVITNSEEWDGKDGVIEEDTFSLEDIMGDD